MSMFQLYMPVRILFGRGRIQEIGSLAARMAKRVMLVTTPWTDAQRGIFQGIVENLERAGVAVTLFDQVCPNPTAESVDLAARAARRTGAELIIGVGGGSSLDAAKAVAVGAAHPGSVWDYIVSGKSRPTEATLPVIAVPTTSGTGAHITQGAVISHAGRKSAIVDSVLFPKACIVDPDLTVTLPRRAWAATGFDALTHALESFIHKDRIRPIDSVALKAVALIIKYLPRVLNDPTDAEARENMAYADTLAGISNANVGTVLPHAMGQAVSGMFPRIAHGESLALVYRAVLSFTCDACTERFAHLARLFCPELANAPELEAAQALADGMGAFLDSIELNPTLETLEIPTQALEELARVTMLYSDTYAHPRIPTQAEVLSLFHKCVR